MCNSRFIKNSFFPTNYITKFSNNLKILGQLKTNEKKQKEEKTFIP